MHPKTRVIRQSEVKEFYPSLWARGIGVRLWRNRLRVCSLSWYTVRYDSDLMAQRLASQAEDREVPGSSPTQD